MPLRTAGGTTTGGGAALGADGRAAPQAELHHARISRTASAAAVTAFFFTAPPFFPFSRAAAALAADVTLPPFCPRATACGFFFMRSSMDPSAWGVKRV